MVFDLNVVTCDVTASVSPLIEVSLHESIAGLNRGQRVGQRIVLKFTKRTRRVAFYRVANPFHWVAALDPPDSGVTQPLMVEEMKSPVDPRLRLTGVDPRDQHWNRRIQPMKVPSGGHWDFLPPALQRGIWYNPDEVGDCGWLACATAGFHLSLIHI